jgi:hypothetical protein
VVDVKTGSGKIIVRDAEYIDRLSIGTRANGPPSFVSSISAAEGHLAEKVTANTAIQRVIACAGVAVDGTWAVPWLCVENGLPAGLSATASVTAVDEVTVNIVNHTAGDLWVPLGSVSFVAIQVG